MGGPEANGIAKLLRFDFSTAQVKVVKYPEQHLPLGEFFRTYFVSLN